MGSGGPAARRMARIIRASLVAVFIAGLALGFFVRPVDAGSKTWTTSLEFTSWKHSSTRVGGGSILLAPAGGGEAVSLKSESLPVARYATSAAWNPTTNKAYMFGGLPSSDKIVEYIPSTGAVATKSAVLPSARAGTTAVWATDQSKFYIFGGTAGGTQILEYNPATDSLVTKSGVLPVAMAYSAAVWNPSTNKAYIFGGQSSASIKIVEYTPATDGVVEKSAVLPVGRAAHTAVWSTINSRAYIFGGDNGVPLADILEYNPATDSIVTKSAVLPQAQSYGAAVYNPDHNRAILFGGYNASGLLAETDSIMEYYPATDDALMRSDYSPLAIGPKLPTNSTFLSAVYATDLDKTYVFGGFTTSGAIDDIVEYNQGTNTFVSSGTATYVFTPTGNYVDWETASHTVSANGQTVTVRYTTNPNCSSGLTTDITALDPSISLCVRADLATSDTSTSPTLDFVTITHSGNDPLQQVDTVCDGNLTASLKSVNFDSLANHVNTGNLTSAIWNTSDSQAYVFAGRGATNSNRIHAYNPATQKWSVKSGVFPSERSDTSAVYNPTTNKSYIFGGGLNSGQTNQIIEYNHATDTVTTKSATLPTARSGTSAVWDASTSRAYIFGGESESGGSWTQTNQILEYNPATDSIVTKSAVLPVAVARTSAAINPSTGKIYIFGGWAGSSQSNKYPTIREYTPSGDTISTLSARFDFGVSETSAVYSSSDGRIYIFGGFGASGLTGYTKRIHVFDPASGELRVSSVEMASERGAASAVYNPSDNKAYIFGGWDGLNRGYFGTTLTFDPQAGSLTFSGLPNRHPGTAAVYSTTAKRAYIFGGQEGSGSDRDDRRQIVEWDPVTNISIVKSTLLPERVEFAAAAINQTTNKAYIFGGYREADYTNKIVEYDIANNSVATKSAVLPTATGYQSAVWDEVSGKIYLFGGASPNSNQILEYNPATDAIVAKSATLPSARNSTAAVWDSVNDVAYIFGGWLSAGSYSNQILKYNPATDGLTIMSATLPAGTILGSATYDPTKQRAYFFGGQTVAASSGINTIVEYNPATDAAVADSDTLLSAMHSSSAIWDPITKTSYIFGGQSSQRSFLEEITQYCNCTYTITRLVVPPPTVSPTSSGGDNPHAGTLPETGPEALFRPATGAAVLAVLSLVLLIGLWRRGRRLLGRLRPAVDRVTVWRRRFPKLRLASDVAVGLLVVAAATHPAAVAKLWQNQLSPSDSIVGVTSEMSLEIPKLSVAAPIVLEVDGLRRSVYFTKLKFGVAHYQGTARPGSVGNAFIFGHSAVRSSSQPYGMVFDRIDELSAGDTVVVTKITGEKYVYTVESRAVVEPTAMEALAQPSGDSMLTLMTCWPKGTIDKRLIVTAKLASV